MKTMPRPLLWGMRKITEAMLTIVTRWEDKHLTPYNPDCRMDQLNTGLWQASRSMKEILEGDFQPMLRQARLLDLPEMVVLGERYTDELLTGAPVPLRAVD
jgi:hypothetical protein